MTHEREIRCFCAGLGLGVAAAILYAPKSGAQMRKQIQDKANDSVEYLKEQATGAANAAADVLDRGAKTIRHQKENVVAAMEAGKQAYRDAAASTPVSDFKL